MQPAERTSNPRFPPRPSSRAGFALAATLMLLAILSLLGAAAIQSTTLEVQISARDRDAAAAAYVAEAGLEEARYYAARGWGKLGTATPLGPGSVEVPVVTPIGPPAPWDALSCPYVGFTLYDAAGGAYLVADCGGPRDAARFVLGSATPPTGGRFVLARELPAPAVAGNRVEVSDPAWALVSPPGTWTGWTLWDASGASYRVADSENSLLAGTVTLVLDRAPGGGPYRMSLLPWAAALAAGTAPAGDADATTPAAWDRDFPVSGGTGRASVTAEETAPGRYRLTSTGAVGPSRGLAQVEIRRAGLPDQTLGGWKVGHED
ncbi:MULTISPECIES: PilX N-terminal domain-containing pilus assembly protein [Deferrisoma]